MMYCMCLFTYRAEMWRCLLRQIENSFCVYVSPCVAAQYYPVYNQAPGIHSHTAKYWCSHLHMVANWTWLVFWPNQSNYVMLSCGSIKCLTLTLQREEQWASQGNYWHVYHSPAMALTSCALSLCPNTIHYCMDGKRQIESLFQCLLCAPLFLWNLSHLCRWTQGQMLTWNISNRLFPRTVPARWNPWKPDGIVLVPQETRDIGLCTESFFLLRIN